jgi:glutaconate CoA-transferase subunit B
MMVDSASASAVTPKERLIVAFARLLEGCRHVAVGTSLPLPAAGALLFRALREAEGGFARVSILGSMEHNFFTNGTVELFDCAAQGRIDAFVLGGGQIDGAGNINLVGTGSYPQSRVRWPGSFGSSFLTFVVPRIILFREEHSRRVLVEHVDFVSAPGKSPPGVHRTGGPHALLTGLAQFSFDRQLGRFRLQTIHPGHTLAEVEDATSFAFDHDDEPAATPDPDAATLALLRERVLAEVAEAYPEFAARLQAEVVGAA